MTYAYMCEKCGEHFSVRATLAEKERGLQVHCPRCGSAEVAQDFSGVGMGFGARPGSSCCGPGKIC
jgi:putative FmdB family regulatory protein